MEVLDRIIVAEGCHTIELVLDHGTPSIELDGTRLSHKEIRKLMVFALAVWQKE